MMYSYYTLSLLRIRCPWKKYLTLAQLTQFASVLCYSACSMWQMPANGTWYHYLGHFIQDFEMTSLFILFMLFYQKAYSRDKNSDDKRRPKTSSADSDITDSVTAEQDSISSQSSDEQSAQLDQLLD
jgi:GNS1/SUR4 family